MLKAIYSIDGTITATENVLQVIEDCKKKNELAKGLQVLENRENGFKRKIELAWIDIHLENHELTYNETLLLSEVFGFHELSIEDCLFPQYYPKIEEFENYVFGAVHGIQLKPNYFQEFEDSIYELNFFVGKEFIITVHTEELFFLETLYEKAKVRSQIEKKRFENLLYNIFNKVVSSYEFTLEKIDDKIESLEDDILEEPETENMQELLDIKKVIFSMRKIAEAQQVAYIYFTRAANNLVAGEYLVYFRDIHTQCARMNQAIVMRSQMVVSLIELYMSSVTVRLTEVMKFLTIIATVLMPVLIVSGYYGMNVLFPEYAIFGQRGSWFFAVGLMVVTILTMLIYFRKKKWF